MAWQIGQSHVGVSVSGHAHRPIPACGCWRATTDDDPGHVDAGPYLACAILARPAGGTIIHDPLQHDRKLPLCFFLCHCVAPYSCSTICAGHVLPVMHDRMYIHGVRDHLGRLLHIYLVYVRTRTASALLCFLRPPFRVRCSVRNRSKYLG